MFYRILIKFFWPDLFVGRGATCKDWAENKNSQMFIAFLEVMLYV